MSNGRAGPLAGLKVIEMVGIGPGPFAAMLLSDLGAEVIRIDRLTPSGNGVQRPLDCDFSARGRRSVALDLKSPEAVALVLDLVDQADALIEGFRPGVMERLGLGPEACLARNPRLAYGRVTGWGQDGPMAQMAGHDINYIALTGVLDAIGRAGAEPTPPMNLVGDFAGGSMLLIIGLLSAILNARVTGQGQVVDAAMVDGATLLATPILGMLAGGLHNGPRGTNMLDSGAPFYDVYICADGNYLSLGTIETKFREPLLAGLGIDAAGFPDMSVRANWPAARRILAERIASRTRDEWAAVFDGTDACVSPVLSFDEARTHPHMTGRGAYVEIGGRLQPAPAPRFSATPPSLPTPTEAPGASGEAVLRDWGAEPARIEDLQRRGVLR